MITQEIIQNVINKYPGFSEYLLRNILKRYSKAKK
ncbi:hypothetical protein BOM_1237 (plasmid) [Borrelia miyamotoi FR64b]|uniref:Uncharacterized protein n=1 Tax=Borrelia miyamotoi FR64b TaxID=1292392 RepID=W5SFX2_9SPIR|nr:hypothetical protein BOM_1237 [Borrelia miyamotoi FR64b]